MGASKLTSNSPSARGTAPVDGRRPGQPNNTKFRYSLTQTVLNHSYSRWSAGLRSYIFKGSIQQAIVAEEKFQGQKMGIFLDIMDEKARPW